MNKNKLAAYMYWGLAVICLLTATLTSDTEITKHVILHLILSVLWFIGGLMYWKRGK